MCRENRILQAVSLGICNKSLIPSDMRSELILGLVVLLSGDHEEFSGSHEIGSWEEASWSKFSRWSRKTAEKLVGPRKVEGPLKNDEDTTFCLQALDVLKTGRDGAVGPEGEEC